MKAIRHATSVLVIAVLCVSLGLGSAAHALSTGCIGGHCGDYTDVSVDKLHLGHTPIMLAKDAPQEPDSTATEGCNLLLCSALLPWSLRPVAKIDPSETVLVWQIGQLSALEEPETPDRPPNL